MNIYIKISFYNFAYFLFSAFLGILSGDIAKKILNSSFINEIKKEDKMKWKQRNHPAITFSQSFGQPWSAIA